MKLQDYIHDKPVLETKRLQIRPLRPADANDLKEWLTIPPYTNIGENAPVKAT